VSTTARIPADALRAFMDEGFVRAGLPPADAARVAALMLRADLSGADAHGVFRMPQYVRRLRAGGVAARPDIVVDRRGPAVALVDGGNGMGHLVMSKAVETATELARESGVAWVGVRRSNHAGPAALYVEDPAAAGLVAIYTVVASANHMAPFGGAEALLGTNPIAIGIPAGEEADVVLDIATTVVSYGTVKNAVMKGEALPEGWMIDPADGRPVVDPARVAGGLLNPIGGYKGSGLALALGLLAGPLNQAAFGREVVDFNADDTTETNTGHALIVLDVARLIDPAVFRAAVDRHLRDLRSARPLPGTDGVRLPGEARAARIRERTVNGVPLAPELVARLDALAVELGIGPLSARR
jgi:LDH2 family malate/lactate/ureidoglycolate dehydrogenase